MSDYTKHADQNRHGANDKQKGWQKDQQPNRDKLGKNASIEKDLRSKGAHFDRNHDRK